MVTADMATPTRRPTKQGSAAWLSGLDWALLALRCFVVHNSFVRGSSLAVTPAILAGSSQGNLTSRDRRCRQVRMLWSCASFQLQSHLGVGGKVLVPALRPRVGTAET